jgi:glucose dehydrogenase
MRTVNWQVVKKQAADALLWLFAAVLLLWIGDWAVWRIRVHYGGGYDTVQVNQILLTPLKNHRMKADEQSTASQPCTRSIFPHAGDDPCWWLRRHADEFQAAVRIL